MKGTEPFAKAIQTYLEAEAQQDEMLKAKLAQPKNAIENVVTYILNQVKESGCIGFADEEIYGMALHFVQEDDLEPGTSLQCQVVINQQVELTAEEVEAAKQQAILKVQREQMEKMRRPVTPKKVQVQQVEQPTLFDF
jgi:hypothetical protein